MFFKIKYKTYVFLYYIIYSVLNHDEEIIENPFLLDKSITYNRKDLIKDSIDNYIYLTNQEIKLEDSINNKDRLYERGKVFHDCILKRC